ncbi:hypothetical protein HBN50_14250 [Halobacteriovorax sp. GB3]|uniref:hypothetical protein n=1 Tax=Halobacteriovorax sp. GB3 TaxID=2719615 RepID=UPI0023601DDB|nr:hypothetical protein [Halobacteriovorax sp. GB3]MDD0854271.1 hypothetical protein [Halobacteriovorax sp. GB3]
MKTTKVISIVAAMAASASSLAVGMGYSTFPLMSNTKMLSTEATGITSSGGGVGAQVRYTYKMNQMLTFDGGLALNGGERDGSIFASADYEIFPDFMNQPRVSLKAQFENSKEFETRKNSFTFAPQVSKGFSFWGKEAYPYASLPLGLKLDTKEKSYESTLSANVGINGHLPIEGYQHLLGNAEVQVDLKDSFTAFVFGVSFPIN